MKGTYGGVSNSIEPEFRIEIARGNIPGAEIVNKFGFYASINGTIEPITDDGIYRTPTTAVALEVVSDNANDTAAGTGARKVTIEGLDGNWDRIEQTVEMNGITAVAIPTSMTRVFRARVEESGTYASTAAGSHAGAIKIQEVAGANDEWAEIGMDAASGFPLGQTEIGVYTIPRGYDGHLMSKHVSIEASKTPSILWFLREGVNKTTAPYDSMRLFERHVGASSEIDYKGWGPIVTVPEMTDIGAMGYVSSQTAAVSVEFQIILIKR